MRYSIRIQPVAFDQLGVIYDYIAEDNPAAAAKTVLAIRRKILSLGTMPRRCPLAPENSSFSEFEIRHLIEGNYRIIFTIERNTVHILDVRHAARLPDVDFALPFPTCR